MSIRDELPGARSRRDAPQAAQFHKSRVCEYRNGPCNKRGKADIAIQDQNGLPVGYVCQRCYDQHMRDRGLSTESTWKETGAQLTTVQPTLGEQHGLHRFADIVSDLDRYADNFDHQGEDE